MGNVLFLVHRIPYPPDKGDKIRSWNLLRHLIAHHTVHLGCFVDDARDWQFTDTLRGMTASAHFAALKPKSARIRGLVSGLLRGEALSLGYFRDAELQAWVDNCLAMHHIDHVVVFSSPMAQYVIGNGTRRAPVGDRFRRCRFR